MGQETLSIACAPHTVSSGDDDGRSPVAGMMKVEANSVLNAFSSSAAFAFA